MNWIIAHKTEVLAGLLGISELMALIPGIKSGGIFDLVVNLLKSAAGKPQA